MKKIISLYSLIALILALTLGVTYAAFTDQSKVLGSSFSIGSADIKLLLDLAAGVGDANLADTKQGPSFSNIGPSWQTDYLVKVYNKGSSTLSLTSNANYETANDPNNVRQYIYVQPFAWNDANNDGLFESSELGASLGARDTIIKYKTVGYNFGQLNAGETKGFVLRFSTEPTLSSTLQGATGIFDFHIDSTSL